MADTPDLTTVSTDAPVTPAPLAVPDSLKAEWTSFYTALKRDFMSNAINCHTFSQRRALADRVQFQVQCFFAMASLENMFDNGGPRFNRVAQQVGIPRNQQNVNTISMPFMEAWVNE